MISNLPFAFWFLKHRVKTLRQSPAPLGGGQCRRNLTGSLSCPRQMSISSSGAQGGPTPTPRGAGPGGHVRGPATQSGPARWVTSRLWRPAMPISFAAYARCVPGPREPSGHDPGRPAPRGRAAPAAATECQDAPGGGAGGGCKKASRGLK